MSKTTKKKTAKKPAFKWKRIGEVGVDSGRLLICDPCYIDSQWQKDSHRSAPGGPQPRPSGEFSYNGCCEATLSDGIDGQLFYKKGPAGAGVVASTAYGDGGYTVYGLFQAGDNHPHAMLVITGDMKKLPQI